MWLATKHGFFSIFQTREKHNLFMVRARAEKDLQNLKNSVSVLKAHEIKVTKHNDYHFRLIVTGEELKLLMQFFASEIDYPNFKDKVKSIPGQKDKLPYYGEIWAAMYSYQSENKSITLFTKNW
jgi:hypothetical protein